MKSPSLRLTRNSCKVDQTRSKINVCLNFFKRRTALIRNRLSSITLQDLYIKDRRNSLRMLKDNRSNCDLQIWDVILLSGQKTSQGVSFEQHWKLVEKWRKKNEQVAF